MQTELGNIKQQVDSLQENTDFITKDIVRIMPTIVSLLSANEKAMQEFHDMRAKDQQHLTKIKSLYQTGTRHPVKDYQGLRLSADRSTCYFRNGRPIVFSVG